LSGIASRDLLLEVLDHSIGDARIAFVGEGWHAVVGRRESSSGLPDVSIRIASPQFFSRVLGEGNLGMAEAFIGREFEVEGGTLEEFLTILLRNRVDEKVRGTPRLAVRVAALRLLNFLHRRQANIQCHYDIGDEVFETFLDSTLTYSCGYARHPDDSVEELQRNKLERICLKLRLEPGQRLLDIGCGYGGLLIHAAERYGVVGVGITNSRNHSERGARNIAGAGFGDKVRIVFGDYREVKDTFDRIVSVGMMEHLRPREYGRFVGVIARCLAPAGLGLLHTIGCSRSRNLHDPFIQRYVFPGSGQPRLSAIASHLERHQLSVLDVENIVRHYAHTVRRWLERFRERQGTLDTIRYDRTFQRMWEYYLACGIAAALASPSAVYQVLFTNDPASFLPLHRV
jgi:cyclopropane-fatty-acyl-phospholipid synthase